MIQEVAVVLDPDEMPKNVTAAILMCIQWGLLAQESLRKQLRRKTSNKHSVNLDQWMESKAIKKEAHSFK